MHGGCSVCVKGKQNSPALKLNDIICTKIDIINFENYSVVYEIPFIGEDGSKNYYVVMTSRKLKHRKNEQAADTKYN